MPDIITIIGRRWKLISLLTVLATAVALIASLLSPKLYSSTATALPANSVLNDKARIFNSNIEGLYPSLGTPDELDIIEGTTKLDTLFIALASTFNLATHYALEDKDRLYKAAQKLKKNSDISRSAYGELKIRVWDKDNALAAQLANTFLQKLNAFHKHIQNSNNALVLQKIKEDVEAKRKEIDSNERLAKTYKHGSFYQLNSDQVKTNSVANDTGNERSFSEMAGNTAALSTQVKEYRNLINQYELSLKTTPDVLLVVENARAALKWDKPNMLQNVVFAFFASLLFSFLLALYFDSRNKVA